MKGMGKLFFKKKGLRITHNLLRVSEVFLMHNEETVALEYSTWLDHMKALFM